MRLIFEPLKKEQALAILNWQYSCPYDYYNFNPDNYVIYFSSSCLTQKAIENYLATTKLTNLPKRTITFLTFLLSRYFLPRFDRCD